MAPGTRRRTWHPSRAIEKDLLSTTDAATAATVVVATKPATGAAMTTTKATTKAGATAALDGSAAPLDRGSRTQPANLDAIVAAATSVSALSATRAGAAATAAVAADIQDGLPSMEALPVFAFDEEVADRGFETPFGNLGESSTLLFLLE
eukprot:TRINITY_DN57028_c0_g1_i1.p1 TRINITY_DN57028_c0_g1~~TRINITY_DN57028_c0_g1_i1.p1  ORF type:complete len:168 (+),score=38.91 TRINITY_DN57028_c0_g1_i1:57-506(+)